MIFFTVNIPISCWRLVPIRVSKVGELVFRIELLVLMHNWWTGFKIFDCLCIILAVNWQNTSVKVEVFFIKDVFFVIIGLFLFAFWATYVLLQLVWLVALKLSIKFFNFFVIEFWNIFKFIAFFLFFTVFFVLLLHSKPEVILSRTLTLCFFVFSILFFLPSNSSYFVHFSPVCTWNDLAMLKLNAWLMSKFYHVFILFITN